MLPHGCVICCMMVRGKLPAENLKLSNAIGCEEGGGKIAGGSSDSVGRVPGRAVVGAWRISASGVEVETVTNWAPGGLT